MEKSGEQIKRKLVLERFRAGVPGGDAGIIPGAMSGRPAVGNAATVFIISAEAVDADEYLALVQKYEGEGFRVRSIHVGRLDERALPGMRKVAEEIRDRFRTESCLILSYGRSLAPLIVACYYVLTGSSPSRAVSRIREHDEGFVSRADEVAFVFKFKRFMNAVSGENEDDYIFQPLPRECGSGGLRPEPVKLEVPSWLRDGERSVQAVETATPESPPRIDGSGVESVTGRETVAPVPESRPSPAREPDTGRLPAKDSETVPELATGKMENEPILTLDDLVSDAPDLGARDWYSLEELARG